MRRFTLWNKLTGTNEVRIEGIQFSNGPVVLDPQGGPAWLYTFDSLTDMILHMRKHASFEVQWIDGDGKVQQGEDPITSILVDILYQVESTNDVTRQWEQQRTQARDIIQNALHTVIHLDQPLDCKPLYRLADVLNVAVLPSLEQLR